MSVGKPYKLVRAINVDHVPAWSGTEVHIEVKARNMHNQVRSIVGTLERVGAGRWTPEQVQRALEAKINGMWTCGARKGLHLMSVIYEDMALSHHVRG